MLRHVLIHTCVSIALDVIGCIILLAVDDFIVEVLILKSRPVHVGAIQLLIQLLLVMIVSRHMLVCDCGDEHPFLRLAAELHTSLALRPLAVPQS